MIAASQYVESLKSRATGAGELLTFADTDALQALDAIVQRKPSLVVLERFFASTPRGAALINRLKADPALANVEIRVVAHDSDYTRVIGRHAPGTGGEFGAPAAPSSAQPATPVAAPPKPAAPQATVPLATAPAPLDQTGTRRAPRFRVRAGTEIQLDGALVTLVDLSTCGAQVVSGSVLRPNQRIRVIMGDDLSSVKCSGVIAWASFELPRGGAGAQYRAGIEFQQPDAASVDAFCARHRQ